MKGNRDRETGLFLQGTRACMSGADGCLLIFDVTNKQSLDQAVTVLNEWEKVDGNSLNKKPPTDNWKNNDVNIKATPPVILVGTQVHIQCTKHVVWSLSELLNMRTICIVLHLNDTKIHSKNRPVIFTKP